MHWRAALLVTDAQIAAATGPLAPAGGGHHCTSWCQTGETCAPGSRTNGLQCRSVPYVDACPGHSQVRSDSILGIQVTARDARSNPGASTRPAEARFAH